MAYLEMQGISKRFGPVVANDNVDFTVQRGEIHGLVGENGAGKSTLMRVLYGLHTPDSGTIVLDGREVTIRHPQQAIALGIGMVHQEFQLVPSLTVAQNIALGYEPTRGLVVDRQAMVRSAEAMTERFGFRLPLDAPVANLSVGEQQRVEILKLLYREAELLILDEPTAVLTPQEVTALFEVLERLKEEGHTIILITHKLHEVRRLCQGATVLRRGRVAGVVDARESSEAEIARLMVGREVQTVQRQESADVGPPVLSVEKLRVKNERGLPAVRDVSLAVCAGEIVGVAGVEGNGQSELVEALAGIRRSRGRIVLDGEEIGTLSPRRRREAGLAVIPEDRGMEGLNLRASIADNLIVTGYYRRPLSRRGVLQGNAIRKMGAELMRRFDVRADGPMTPAGALSGGNAQKVIIAREVAQEPRLLVAAHPTRGLDIGAAQTVREELLRLRREGVAVLLVSADLDEILAVSDRMVVFYEGQIVGELRAEEATVERLGLLMSGAGEATTVLQQEDAPID
ncbi:MAG: ABC transporter ATP-binding protein [bacterium]